MFDYDYKKLKRKDKQKQASKRAKKRGSVSPEKKIEREIMNHFKEKGFLVIKFSSAVSVSEYTGVPIRAYWIANTKSSKGLSDLIIFKDGLAVFMEVKTPSNRQTDSQKKFEGIVEKTNNYYAVVRSIEDAEKAWKQAYQIHYN